jgi:hypothetical protein
MATEMPERVEPIAGAVEVEFPWAEARAAVTALDAAAARLEDQLGQRPGMVDEPLHQWEGAYRDQFNDGHSRLLTYGSYVKGNLRSYASGIATGAENANAEQRQNNGRVDTRVGGNQPV